MRTSPLGPISPPWAPPRAGSPAGSQSGKRALRELGLGDRLPMQHAGWPHPMPLTGLLGRPRWVQLWALRVLKARGGRPALQSRPGGGDGPQQEPRLQEGVGPPPPEACQSQRPAAASPLEPCSPGSLPWGLPCRPRQWSRPCLQHGSGWNCLKLEFFSQCTF